MRGPQPVFEFELQHCTRRCAISGRELQPGETYYSVLRREDETLHRSDYSSEVWTGPPNDATAWWQAKLPEREDRKPTATPNEVLLGLFESLSGTSDADLRYVVALLLIRRRLLRVEESQRDSAGIEILTLYCPRNGNTVELAAVVPDEARVCEIQDQLSRLLG